MQPADITQILNSYQTGQPELMEQLFPIVYHELRRTAHNQLKHAWSVDTICTTALVNEAYIKLVNNQKSLPTSRAHFFAIAATAMHQILINYAEQKTAQKRGRDWKQVTSDEAVLKAEFDIETLLDIDKALDQIKELDEELARLVELRFFAGMTDNEIAQLFRITDRTVRRNWVKAKALLAQALQP